MVKPIILAQGKFKPEDIAVTVSESSRKIDPEIESQIEQLWEKKLQGAQEKGQKIYNGLSYRLNSLKSEHGKLDLDFGVFDFKTRECLLEAEGYFDLSEDFWRKGCHTLATVKTSDSKYLLVDLSGKSMNLNKTVLLGGIMETEPPIKVGEDLFESLFRELEEEAFIKRSEIVSCLLKLVYINSKTNVGFYFEVPLNISSIDLEDRFNSSEKEIDIKSLKILSREEYLNILKNHNENKQFLANLIEI